MQTTEHSFFDIPVKQTVLDNGFTVFTMDTGTCMSHVEVIIRAGHCFDGEVPGISHFLEHVVHSGPDPQEWHPLLRPLIYLGAYSNAVTGDLSTRYLAGLPSEHHGRAVSSMLEMVFGPTFDKKRVDIERHTILDEVRTFAPSKERSMRKNKLLYPNVTRWHISSIGTPETIGAIDEAALEVHHRKFYTPDQTALIVVGKVDHEAVVRLAESQGMPHARGTREPIPVVGPRLFRTSIEEQETPCGIQIYFDGVDSNVDRIRLAYVLDLLTDVEVGILFRRLRLKERWIYSLRAKMSDYPRIIKLKTSVMPERFNDVEEAIFEEINKIAGGEFSEEAFGLLSTRRRISQKSEVERMATSGWADGIGHRWLFDDYEDRRAQVLATTRDQVSLAADKYLRRDRYGCFHIFHKE